MLLLGSLRHEDTRVSCGLMHQNSEIYRACLLTLEQVLHGLSRGAMSALRGGGNLHGQISWFSSKGQMPECYVTKDSKLRPLTPGRLSKEDTPTLSPDIEQTWIIHSS